MEAALSHRTRGVGSPETEHENVAVDPTKSCCIMGIAITEGATGGGGSGRRKEAVERRDNKSTHTYTRCQTMHHDRWSLTCLFVSAFIASCCLI